MWMFPFHHEPCIISVIVVVPYFRLLCDPNAELLFPRYGRNPRVAIASLCRAALIRCLTTLPVLVLHLLLLLGIGAILFLVAIRDRMLAVMSINVVGFSWHLVKSMFYRYLWQS